MPALAISVRWGEVLVESTMLRSDGLRSEPLSAIDARRAHFTMSQTGPVLHFSDGVRGEVLRNGETPLAMSEAIHRGLAYESGDGWSLPIGRRDRVLLRFGALEVEALPTKEPVLVPSLPDAWDFRWLNVLLATSLLATLLLVRFELSALEGAPLDEDGLSNAVATMRRVLVMPAQKPRLPPALAATDLAEARPQRRQPAAAGAPSRQPRPTSSGRAAPKLDLSRIIAGIGASDVFGPGGLSAELTLAAGRMVGAADGLGGIALRGAGTGGEVGGPLQLGRLGLRGGPTGSPSLEKYSSAVGFCDGPGPCKSDQNVSIDSAPHILCGGEQRSALGCVDKELIRRVVRANVGQVRYCYEQLLSRFPTLGGRVVVKWHVTPEGTVDTSEVVQSSAASSELGACLAGRVRTWRFPTVKNAAAGFAVSYPFVFKLSGS